MIIKNISGNDRFFGYFGKLGKWIANNGTTEVPDEDSLKPEFRNDYDNSILEVVSFDDSSYDFVAQAELLAVSGAAKRILSVGRNNAVVTNLWLSGEDGVPTNLSPFVVSGDMEITDISLSTSANSTWEVEIYKDTDIVSPPVPANRIAVLAATAEKYKRLILPSPVSVPDQTRLAIYANGTGITHPHVDIYLKSS